MGHPVLAETLFLTRRQTEQRGQPGVHETASSAHRPFLFVESEHGDVDRRGESGFVLFEFGALVHALADVIDHHDETLRLARALPHERRGHVHPDDGLVFRM